MTLVKERTYLLLKGAAAFVQVANASSDCSSLEFPSTFSVMGGAGAGIGAGTGVGIGIKHAAPKRQQQQQLQPHGGKRLGVHYGQTPRSGARGPTTPTTQGAYKDRGDHHDAEQARDPKP